MNNGKYTTAEYKTLQSQKNERIFGPVLIHIKTCERCGNEFNWEGREHTKAYKQAKFCNRSCANNRQQWWNNNATHYKTIAMQHYKHECVVCGFDKIVAVHHIDENHFNNDPKNLIPLCPNHHEMVHSKWKNEIIPFITEWQDKWAVGIVGTQ